MPEMMDYIFGRLHELDKSIRRQRRFNSAVLFYSLAVMAYIAVEDMREQAQQERLKQLEEKLKKMEKDHPEAEGEKR